MSRTAQDFGLWEYEHRYDQHYKAMTSANESVWGRALAAAGWEWDTIPMNINEKGCAFCQVVAWHATTGRMINALVVEEYMALELLDIIASTPRQIADEVTA